MIDLNKFLVKKESEVNLNSFTTLPEDEKLTKDFCRNYVDENIGELIKQQELFYVNNNNSLLIVLQALDAAGKDGVIKHVFSKLNLQGLEVNSFKHPTNEDYEHDFFWRYHKVLPPKGKIGIFNRSYYEHALICRVHPQLILNEKIPGYNSLDSITNEFWNQRFKQFNSFEKTLNSNGQQTLKFFLHISKEEQLNRLSDRLNEPRKHYKFNFADIKERNYWSQYIKCFEDLLQATSTKHSPWYIIPSDNKWYARMLIFLIVTNYLKSLKLSYPVMSNDEIIQIKSQLK